MKRLCVVCGRHVRKHEWVDQVASWVHFSGCVDLLQKRMEKEEEIESRIWAALARKHPCKRCGARPGQSCLTRTGHGCKNHKGRGE